MIGLVVSVVVEPFWRGARPVRVIWLVLVAEVVLTLVWASTLSFFGLAHLVYLLATVVPACVAITALSSGPGRRWLRTRVGAVVGVALLIPPLAGLYATHVEPFWLRVDRVEVPVEAGAGIRVGVLADLQTTSIGGHEREAVAALIDQDPDLVVVPGDLWQTDDEDIAADWPMWADLLSELVDAVGPVVIVEGNTDHIGWIELIAERSGAVALYDRVEVFDIDGTSVAIGGTRDVDDTPAGATLRAMEELVGADRGGAITIALTHRPDILDWLPGRVDLVVTGHTHGGQIQVPFVGPLMTATSAPRHVAAGGLHAVDGQLIYVSTGVGLERRDAPQVRFGVRPSVGILDLVAPRG